MVFRACLTIFGLTKMACEAPLFRVISLSFSVCEVLCVGK